MKKIILFLLVCLHCIYLHAEVKLLVQPGFDWHEPTAWSPMGVPSAQDTVEIYGYTFIKVDSVARAKHVYIGVNGELDLRRNLVLNLRGALVVEDSDDIGIINEGIIDNGGRITIRNTAGYGIQNYGSTRVKEGAKINIKNSSVVAIENWNELHNHGLIDIELESIAYGIYSRANFSNFNTGQIIINSSPDDGFGIAINSLSDTLLNEGVIEIRNHNTAIINRGTTINKNLIIIDSLYTGDGIKNSNIFLNDTIGNIEVSNILGTNNSAISNSSLDTFLNYGEIRIQDLKGGEGIENEGLFYNYDTIHIRRVNDNGIINRGRIDNFGYLKVSHTKDNAIENLDTFYNRPTGILRILNLDTIGKSAIHNDSAFLMNEGTINIDNIPSGYGIFNTGEFINTSYTYIDKAEEIGFFNEGLCVIEGNSLIDISALSDLKMNEGFSNTGNLSIHGTLKIGYAKYGLNNGQQTDNHGFIQINNCDEYGIANFDTLHNREQGFIDISVPEKQNAIGIYNSFSNATSIVNDGTLKIEGPRPLQLHQEMNYHKSQNSGNIIGIENHGYMSNDSLIFIAGMDTGIDIEANSPISEFNNSGILALFDNLTYSFVLKGNFNNHLGGEILINSTSGVDIEIMGGATFDCYGILDTDSSYIPPFDQM